MSWMSLKFVWTTHKHFYGLKLSGVSELFLSRYDFLVQKCINQRFGEQKG